MPSACKVAQALDWVEGEGLHEGDMAVVQRVGRARGQDEGDVLIEGPEATLELIDPGRGVCDKLSYTYVQQE